MSNPSAPGSGLQIRGISHVLLDIEGTTCPVSFVSETLFPYAHDRLAAYLDRHRDEAAVGDLLREIRRAWENEAGVGAPVAPAATQADPDLVPYLQWLIRQDRKLPALKELQGRVWEQGYACGDLRPQLFTDVEEALRHWHHAGKILAVYSSGSVPAQQLLYQFASGGDLRPLFSHWFDTKTGAKTHPDSYRAIASRMGVACERVLFVSDAPAELTAAEQAGLFAVFSNRAGNPIRWAEGFPEIGSLLEIELPED
jgi:enolase-phosphatase E1